MTDTLIKGISIDVELREELEAYLRLRPYLARLLKLNHSINNSIAGIMGNAEFLCEEGENLTTEQHEFAQQILMCANQIRDSIEELRAKSLTREMTRDLKSLTKVLQALDTSD